MAISSYTSLCVLLVAICISHHALLVYSFSPPYQSLTSTLCGKNDAHHNNNRRNTTFSTAPLLYANDDTNESPSDEPSLTNSDAATLATVGLLTSSIMLYSESVLFQTGCGLPAGPFGLTGAIEGISYLTTTALVGYSIYNKIRTGKGLPAGPGSVLGAAEGLAYIAIFAGFWVLISQVVNYGYVPNAVPMEGGMCQ